MRKEYTVRRKKRLVLDKKKEKKEKKRLARENKEMQVEIQSDKNKSVGGDKAKPSGENKLCFL